MESSITIVKSRTDIRRPSLGAKDDTSYFRLNSNLNRFCTQDCNAVHTAFLSSFFSNHLVKLCLSKKLAEQALLST